MANVLLGATGSVAAIRTPELFRLLTQAGHAVKIVATAAATYFFRPADLPPGVLYVDADEWPRRGSDVPWQREDTVLHIELRRWADLFAVAPLDANTLAKLAGGLCDNALTCVARAWDPARPVLLAPAMNTLMWRHPHTRRHLRTLAELAGAPPPPRCFDEEELLGWINAHCPRLHVVGPGTKRLACGDVGVGAMAEAADIVAAAQAILGRSGLAASSMPRE